MLPTASGVDDDAAAPARRRTGVAAISIKQQSDPTPAAEDVPASTYARLERSVVAWLVADNVLYTFASLSKKSVRLPFLLMENLMFPICLSVCMLYAFGTLDSSAVRKRVVVMWVSFMLYQAVFSFVFCWVQGYPLARAVGITVFFVLIAAGFSWLIGIIRDELRALGSLDATRVKRLFEIMGIQLALVVVGATQGLGRGDMPRIVGTVTFSQSLTMAWFYSLAIFDVAGVDVAVAGTRLQLRAIEGAALFFTGALVLAGFAAYVVSEQNDPSRKMAIAVFFVFAASMIGAYFCTARIVTDARRKRGPKVSDDLPA